MEQDKNLETIEVGEDSLQLIMISSHVLVVKGGVSCLLNRYGDLGLPTEGFILQVEEYRSKLGDKILNIDRWIELARNEVKLRKEQESEESV